MARPKQDETLTAHRDRQRAKAEIQKLRTDYLSQQRKTYNLPPTPLADFLILNFTPIRTSGLTRWQELTDYYSNSHAKQSYNPTGAC